MLLQYRGAFLLSVFHIHNFRLAKKKKKKITPNAKEAKEVKQRGGKERVKVEECFSISAKKSSNNVV